MEFEEILKKAVENEITREEALYLFKETDKYDKALKLFEIASRVRDDEVGNVFKIDGHISIQPCNRNPHCRFCFSAAERDHWSSQVLNPEEASVIAKKMRELGIKRVNIGGGLSGDGGKKAIETTEAIKSVVPNIEVYTNIAADFTEDSIRTLNELGVQEMICHLEIFNQSLFEKIRPPNNLGDTYDRRMKIHHIINDLGINVGDGLMVGVGEPYEDRVNHLFYLKNYENLSAVLITGFHPIPTTPMENYPSATLFDNLKTIAITRLVHRNIDIHRSFAGADLPVWVMAGVNRRVHAISGGRRRLTEKPFSRHKRRFGETIPVTNDLMIGSVSHLEKLIEEIGLVPETKM